jgi:hypothetical protein
MNASSVFPSPDQLATETIVPPTPGACSGEVATGSPIRTCAKQKKLYAFPG